MSHLHSFKVRKIIFFWSADCLHSISRLKSDSPDHSSFWIPALKVVLLMIQLDCGAFYGATLSCFPLFSPRVGLPSHTISYKYRPFLFTSPFYTMKNPVILFMALIDACCLTSCDRRVRVSFPFLFPPQCLQISPWEKEISRIVSHASPSACLFCARLDESFVLSQSFQHFIISNFPCIFMCSCLSAGLSVSLIRT